MNNEEKVDFYFSKIGHTIVKSLDEGYEHEKAQETAKKIIDRYMIVSNNDITLKNSDGKTILDLLREIDCGYLSAYILIKNEMKSNSCR